MQELESSTIRKDKVKQAKTLSEKRRRSRKKKEKRDKKKTNSTNIPSVKNKNEEDSSQNSIKKSDDMKQVVVKKKSKNRKKKKANPTSATTHSSVLSEAQQSQRDSSKRGIENSIELNHNKTNAALKDTDAKSVSLNHGSGNHSLIIQSTEFDNHTDSEPKKNSKRGLKRKKGKAPGIVLGSSNWSQLCSEMKKNPGVRKTHTDTPDTEKEPSSKLLKSDVAESDLPNGEVWFDDVDEALLERKQKSSAADVKSLVKQGAFSGKTKCVGMDCEMVGVGQDGVDSILARVSLVNIYGHCLYDKFVLPTENVTDYRTEVSGVTEKLLREKGEPFVKVQKEVSEIIQDSVLVGHALHNDLKVLFLSHPHKNIRDTSIYKPFQELFNGRRPALKKLTEKILGVNVQDGSHSSVEDAQAAMRLYTRHRVKWEKEIKSRIRRKRQKRSDSKKPKKKPSRDDDEKE